MLSVPGLAWPFLLGENHQQSTKAIVYHHALTIIFRHPQLIQQLIVSQVIQHKHFHPSFQIKIHKQQLQLPAF